MKSITDEFKETGNLKQAFNKVYPRRSFHAMFPIFKNLERMASISGLNNEQMMNLKNQYDEMFPPDPQNLAREPSSGGRRRRKRTTTRKRRKTRRRKTRRR